MPIARSQESSRAGIFLRLFALLMAAGVSVTSCTAPPPPPAATLPGALLTETGYRLGEGAVAEEIAGAECAAESRYDGAAGPVQLLVCVAPHAADGRRIRYRISFSPPEDGHRIWKIDASLPDQTLRQSEIPAEFAKKYGPPEVQQGGKTLKWQVGTAYLEIREDRYGVQFSLWDRSLRQR
ncbi:hypothetical protein GQF03_16770 [Sneathiella chungangensis]|uniref:DUF4352 domain-containing protein n=1 Tax=Sneathiella chungangensis TaxID=1418234 RepID=A0A845ML23_9PROT|nr:hypothetical protein [Sneathiella chungangensis]MZR23990.1 hypothetical protein [Sneathiella chungangensis]